MEQARLPFEYSRLPLHSREIRIFRLLPARAGEEDNISGEIFTINLDGSHRFTALSYAWGDNRHVVNIETNGGLLPITLSLKTALQGLREAEPLDLWIDQICINQDDDDEKAHQIPLMKDIYTLSTQTIAWLGPGSTEQAIAYLERVGRQFSSFGIRVMTKKLQEQLLSDEDVESAGLITIPESLRETKRKIKEMIEAEGEWHEIAALAELEEFFNVPYFKRGWIKQEVALPPKLLVKRGNSSIDGDILYCGLLFHTLHWQRDMRGLKDIIRGPMTLEIGKKIQTLLADRPGRDAANTSMVARAKLHNPESESPVTLGQLLRRFRLNSSYTSGGGGEEATLFSDHKDYIYGFLGLASDAETLAIPIQTSSSVSPEKVYIDATKRIIEAGDVEFIFLAHRPQPHPNLPSWVPDFRSVCEVPHLTYGTIISSQPFSASSGRSQSTRPHALSDADPDVLALEGIPIDVVGATGEAWPIEADGERKLRNSAISQHTTQLLISEAIEIMKRTPNHPLWATEEQRRRWEEASWRIPIADQEYVGNTPWHSQRATAERSKVGAEQLAEVVVRHRRILVNGESPDVVIPLTEDEERSLAGLEGAEQSARRTELWMKKIRPQGELCNNYASALSVSAVRRGYRGVEGFVGIGPLELQDGDIICVLFGATVPVALRPLHNGFYSYIGDLYCHGIMDGEALTWGKEAQWFNLR